MVLNNGTFRQFSHLAQLSFILHGYKLDQTGSNLFKLANWIKPDQTGSTWSYLIRVPSGGQFGQIWSGCHLAATPSVGKIEMGIRWLSGAIWWPISSQHSVHYMGLPCCLLIEALSMQSCGAKLYMALQVPGAHFLCCLVMIVDNKSKNCCRSEMVARVFKGENLNCCHPCCHPGRAFLNNTWGGHRESVRRLSFPPPAACTG